MADNNISTELQKKITEFTQQVYDSIIESVKSSLSDTANETKSIDIESNKDELIDRIKSLFDGCSEELKSDSKENDLNIINQIYHKALSELKNKLNDSKEETEQPKHSNVFDYKLPDSIIKGFKEEADSFNNFMSADMQFIKSGLSDHIANLDLINAKFERVKQSTDEKPIEDITDLIKNKSEEEPEEIEIEVEEVEKEEEPQPIQQSEVAKESEGEVSKADVFNSFLERNEAVNESMEKKLSLMRKMWGKFNSVLKSNFKLMAKNLLKGLKNKFKDWLTSGDNLISIAYLAGQAIWTVFKEVTGLLRWLATHQPFKTVLKWVEQFAKWIGGKIGGVAKKFFDGFMKHTEGIRNFIKDIYLKVKGKVVGFFQKWIGKFKDLMKSIGNGIKNFFVSVWNTKFVKSVRNFFTKVKDIIKSIYNTVMKPIRALITKLKSLISTIKSAITTAKDVAKTGKGLLSKIGGFFSKFNILGKIKNAAKGFMKWLPKIKKFFGAVFKVVGFIFDAIDAFQRFKQGDWIGGVVHGALALIGGLGFVPGLQVLIPVYNIASSIIGGFELVYSMSSGKSFNYTLQAKKLVKMIVNDFADATKVETKIVYVNKGILLKDNYEKITVEKVGEYVPKEQEIELVLNDYKLEPKKIEPKKEEPVEENIEVPNTEEIEVEPIRLNFGGNFDNLINSLTYRVKTLNG